VCEVLVLHLCILLNIRGHQLGQSRILVLAIFGLKFLDSHDLEQVGSETLYERLLLPEQELGG
jgi:hypothetical protein